MRMAIVMLWVVLLGNGVRAEGLQIGLANDVVSITSNFTGSDVVVFGSIEEGDPRLLLTHSYEIVVVLVGPRRPVTVRRKERKLGIWVNGASQSFNNVPASYSLASTSKLEDLAPTQRLVFRQIGIKNLNLQSSGVSRSPKETDEFRRSLERLKRSRSLYRERHDGVKFLSPSLFRARLRVPANVPIGQHTARAFLFHDGKLLASQSVDLDVRKDGFEQLTYDMAHQNGLLYGIIAVLIAIATGWIASVVFRKD